MVLIIALSGGLAERQLRRRELARIESSLEAKARLVRELAGPIAFASDNEMKLDAIADRAQQAAQARVTLIDRSGVVVGDSSVPLAKLRSVESHANRPEVAAAFRGEVGTSTRRSATVGQAFLYLALPAEHPGGGVVRLAVDLSDVDAAVWELRRDLLVAGGVGLLATVAFAALLSWLTLRPLRELREVAASIAGGDLDSRVSLRSIEELGGISSAINAMAEQIRGRIDDLTREKERLGGILNGMVEGVLVVDAGGRVLLANTRMREFYAIAGTVEGRPALEVVRDADVDRLFADAAATDEPVSRRIVAVAAGGRTFRVHAARFPSGGGTRAGTVAVFHDVSELARLEAVRRDFVANASHELRTPVAAISGFAETLRSAASLSEADRNSYLEIIQRHATRLGNLVADLLQLATVEGRESPLDPAPVDVALLAQVLVRDSQKLGEERGLQVELVVEAPAVAWGRREDVEQVIGNLLGNAVNYTDPGGRVELRVGVDGEFVRVSVADTGIGIPWQHQERIFERFYRVDASRSRAVGGTGLGLSIVRHLVLGMNGQIAVDSAVGRGSTFTVRLPSAA